MVRVYAIVLIVGLLALIAWILIHAVASTPGSRLPDPETRFGVPGRRLVAGLVGFSMAGLSAEFSPRDIGWPLALLLAILGGGVLAWYAGRPELARTDEDARVEQSD